jgi:hypothetical protein
MAAQRLTTVTLAGQQAIAAAALFSHFRSVRDPAAVDRFCAALRENAFSPAIVYFCEWVDRWLMGDLVPGPDKVEGRQYEAACFSPLKAQAWADQCGQQFVEHEWLATRLREAAAAWDHMEARAVVVLREAFDVSRNDEEVEAAFTEVPDWLCLPAAPPAGAPDDLSHGRE